MKRKPKQSWRKILSWGSACLKGSPVMLLLLAGCGGKPGPQPPTPPTPTPPPSMALHVQGGRLVTAQGDPRILGTIVGCHLDGISGWPFVCQQSLDQIKAAGLNWTHIRTGPFTAEAEAPQFAFYERGAGGKYDLTKINQNFLNFLRDTCLLAKDRGIYCEVDIPGDRWPIQHKVSPWQADQNVQGENHSGLVIFQSPPDAIHQAAIRAVVRTLCDNDAVMWSTGNEAFKGASAAWEQPVVAMLRECAKPHVIGANSVEGAPFADYVIVHQSNAPNPIGRPVMVNEFGPDISPSDVVNESIKADTAGTYFGYWRGSHSAAEWISTMQKLGQIRAGTPPPPTPGCAIPSTDVPQVKPRPGSGPQIEARNRFVDEAEAFVKSSHPEMFEPDGSLKGWPSDGAAQSLAAQPYFNLLVDFFRSRGACGIAWEDSIGVGWQGDGWYEENHVLAFGSGKPIEGRFAYRFTWAWPNAGSTAIRLRAK